MVIDLTKGRLIVGLPEWKTDDWDLLYQRYKDNAYICVGEFADEDEFDEYLEMIEEHKNIRCRFEKIVLNNGLWFNDEDGTLWCSDSEFKNYKEYWILTGKEGIIYNE